LKKILSAEEIWCQLFSEPGAGSDLAGLSTRAELRGDTYHVTGQKVWTSYARFASFGIGLVRTDPDAPKHKGITYFIVDMTSPGFDVRPLRQMTGASHFSEVFIDGVRIPAENVLGEVNGGWACAVTTLSNERGLIAGGNRSSDSVALIAQAQKLGRSTDPVLRQALVDCWTRQQIQRYLGYRAQTAMSQGRAPGPETSIMKLFAAEYLRRLGNAALEMLGPDGMLTNDWGQRFLHAPSIRIAGGSNEIQRNIVGERVLGLPRDPK
jgi:alkylation response protein AidB-like acyl-CoA dehydrogenase